MREKSEQVNLLKEEQQNTFQFNQQTNKQHQLELNEKVQQVNKLKYELNKIQLQLNDNLQDQNQEALSWKRGFGMLLLLMLSMMGVQFYNKLI